ncbi:MAG: inositol-3-phosphate synthase, partial [Candidatus Eisenbacteria bacterium]|nr:inositol-3-phosphate synthase [Candidatus Eisenbacteria bacterium]
MSQKIQEAQGKLGVLLPGLGAVATTFIAGCLAMRKGIAEPIGSLTQTGTIRLGKRTDKRSPKINEFVSLAKLDDMVFGGWDIFPENTYEAAMKAGVLAPELLAQVKDEMEAISPWPAVFDQRYVKRLHGEHVKKGANWMELAEQLMEDIKTFQKDHGLARMVMVWCGSTEVFMKPGPAHQSLSAFEKAMRENDPSIAPSMVYAYAAIKLGIPYANGAPNLSADFPALVELAKETRTPLGGKDFKTGQTL